METISYIHDFEEEHIHYSYNPDIEDAVYGLLDNALARSAKVLMIRFDIRFPLGMEASNTNRELKRFLNNYKRYLDRRRYKPTYLWCAERKRSHNIHYHICFLLDGTKIQYMPNLDKANELWNSIVDYHEREEGLIHFCNPNGTIIRRGDDYGYRSAANYIMYLAKSYTKINIPGVRSWGRSFK